MYWCSSHLIPQQGVIVYGNTFVVEELDKEIAVQSDQRTAHSDEAENIADEGPANNGTHEY